MNSSIVRDCTSACGEAIGTSEQVAGGAGAETGPGPG